MPRASTYHRLLPAVLCGKQSTLLGSRGGENQQEVGHRGSDLFFILTKGQDTSKAGVGQEFSGKGKKWSWDPLGDSGS